MKTTKFTNGLLLKIPIVNNSRTPPPPAPDLRAPHVKNPECANGCINTSTAALYHGCSSTAVKHSLIDPHAGKTAELLTAEQLLQHVTFIGQVDGWQQLEMLSRLFQVFVLEFGSKSAADDSIRLLNNTLIQGVEVEVMLLSDCDYVEQALQADFSRGKPLLGKKNNIILFLWGGG